MAGDIGPHGYSTLKSKKMFNEKKIPAQGGINELTMVDPEFAERERHFFERFPDDRSCLDHLVETQFGELVTCPKCGRTAKFHKIRDIPAYACQWCGYHLHPMAQTRFARSRIGLRTWFHAAFLFSQEGNGISARELQQLLGLTYKTAWRMRNTIVDAKSQLPGYWRRRNEISFDDLLAALIRPADSPPPDRPG